jgi:hypothetical protein
MCPQSAARPSRQQDIGAFEARKPSPWPPHDRPMTVSWPPLSRNSTILRRLWLNRGRTHRQGRFSGYRIGRSPSAARAAIMRAGGHHLNPSAAPPHVARERAIKRILASPLCNFLLYPRFSRGAGRADFPNKFKPIGQIGRWYKDTPAPELFSISGFNCSWAPSMTSWCGREGQRSALHKMKNDHGIAAAVPAVAGHVVRSLSPHRLRRMQTRRMNARYSGGVRGPNNNHKQEIA